LFIPISENLNTGWKNIRTAVEKRDGRHIAETARRAVAGGAKALNVSGACGPENELENLLWALGTALGAADFVPSLDSADPEVLAGAAEGYLALSGRRPPERYPGRGEVPWLIVNSVSGEDARYGGVARLAVEYRAAAIALAMDGAGVPADAEGRVKAAAGVVERLRKDGAPDHMIFVDALAAPVGVNVENGLAALEAVRRLRAEFPDVRITCGLSNVSVGLPDRRVLNQAYLPMLVAAGLDSAIVDTTDPLLMKSLGAALALAGRDPYCAEYLENYRKREKERVAGSDACNPERGF